MAIPFGIGLALQSGLGLRVSLGLGLDPGLFPLCGGTHGLTVGRLIVGGCKQMIRKIVIPGSNSWTNDLDRGNRCFLSSMLAVFSYMNTSTRSGIGSQSNRAWSVLRSLSWSKHR